MIHFFYITFIINYIKCFNEIIQKLNNVNNNPTNLILNIHTIINKNGVETLI